MIDFALSPLLLPKKHDHSTPTPAPLEASVEASMQEVSAAEIETWQRTHHCSHQFRHDR